MADPLGRSRIPEILLRRGKSRTDLADHLEVTIGYISNVCTNKETLSVLNTKRTSEFLDCYMDDLTDWDQKLFKDPLKRTKGRGSELL